MKNITAYLSILVFIVCILQANAHDCVHDESEFEPVKLDMLEDLDEVENLDLDAPQTFQPIRIRADFSGMPTFLILEVLILPCF